MYSQNLLQKKLPSSHKWRMMKQTFRSARNDNENDGDDEDDEDDNDQGIGEFREKSVVFL